MSGIHVVPGLMPPPWKRELVEQMRQVTVAPTRLQLIVPDKMFLRSANHSLVRHRQRDAFHQNKGSEEFRPVEEPAQEVDPVRLFLIRWEGAN